MAWAYVPAACSFTEVSGPTATTTPVGFALSGKNRLPNRVSPSLWNAKRVLVALSMLLQLLSLRRRLLRLESAAVRVMHQGCTCAAGLERTECASGHGRPGPNALGAVCCVTAAVRVRLTSPP